MREDWSDTKILHNEPMLYYPFMPLLRRLLAHDKTLDSLKIALAFGGVLAFCFGTGHEGWLIGLLLGTIASALAETPDRFAGRLKALIVTLICFSIASFSVRLLYPHPWLFAAGLASSVFIFVMLGVLGERYAAIATASVILAIYTMLGIAQHPEAHGPFWLQPVLLLSGASFYGLISLLASLLFSSRPASLAVAKLFKVLSTYLELKAGLLEPAEGRDLQACRIALATENGRVVGLMNRTREILLRWTQTPRPARGSQRLLQWYFLAQDIHERASSSHYPYEALGAAFARSDVLFRSAHLMRVQAANCARLGEAIAQDQGFEYGEEGRLALEALQASLEHVLAHSEPGKPETDSLARLCQNLGGLEQSLARADRPEALEALVDSSLRDRAPQTPSEMIQRLRQQCAPSSRSFRHALRLSLALTAGYGLMHLLKLPQGYWVMLTTAFVCQPNFSSTWRRLGQRIGGTVMGLVCAALFVSVIPHPLAQLMLILIAGVAFFHWRTERYLSATACITVMVLLCFNQLGSGYALFWPRLLDTLLGSLLAVAAVALILPDWQGRRLHQVRANALRLTAAYLEIALRQYREGKRDDLPYRIARREAHDADAELSSTLTSMLLEPGRYRLSPDMAYRFLCASHTLLAYVSALGAHREALLEWQSEPLLETHRAHIQSSLLRIAEALARHEAPTPLKMQNLEEDVLASKTSELELSLIRQLRLIEDLIPELHSLAEGFAESTSPSG